MSSEDTIVPPLASTSTRPQSQTQLKPHKTINPLLSSTSNSNLRDTLSSFGDDLVRIKDSNFLYFEGNEYSPDFQQMHQSQIQFERVPSEEVGVKSSRWRKAIVAGLFSSSRSNSAKPKADDSKGSPEDGMERESPPFWGVGPKSREKISMLSLQLILHELACFASCVLTGCLAVQLITGVGIF